MLERLLRLHQLFFGAPAREQDALRVLQRDGSQQILLGFLALDHALAQGSSASAVPSTRALIFAKALSRVVDVSSQKGEKPQSSVVPS